MPMFKLAVVEYLEVIHDLLVCLAASGLWPLDSSVTLSRANQLPNHRVVPAIVIAGHRVHQVALVRQGR